MNTLKAEMAMSKTELEKLREQLIKVEKRLDTNRTSTIQDGWQTQRFAKKSRNWDYYAQLKMKIIQRIDELQET